MTYLLLAIICSTCLLVVFKLIERHNLEKLPVIIVNYFTAAAIGAITTPGKISFGYFTAQSWFPLALMLGAFFIIVFYSVALSTQISGISVTSVAFKLSLVIPVTAAWLLYGDEFGILKIAGILLAIAAIFLTSRNGADTKPNAKGIAMFLPAFVFIGSGICDSAFNYIQHEHLAEDSYSSFLIILFLTAGTAGALLFTCLLIAGKTSIKLKTILAGAILGIPNYGSAYFMILALEYSGVQASALWTMNNIGIILLSTVTAAVFFNEKLSKPVVAGICFALISIALIAVSSLSF